MREARVPLKYVADLNSETLGDDTAPDYAFRYIDIAMTGHGILLDEPEPMVFETAPSRARRVLRSGDTILSTVRTYLRAVWTLRDENGDLIASTGFVCIRPRAVMDQGFLGWLAQADLVIEEVVARSVGVSYPAINPSDVGRIKVPCPRLIDQRVIADYLDRETFRIDVLIAAKRRMIALLEEEHRVRQVAILTGARFGFGQTHPVLGSLPADWSVRRAKFCTSGITVGVVVNPSNYFVDDGVPFIHGTDIREGFIAATDCKMLSAESNQRLAKSQIRAGDVIAMRVGYPGRAAVVPPELDGANCASVLIFRRSPILHPEFMCEFLNSPLGRAQIEATQYGAAQGVLNVSDAVDLCVPVPPPSCQEMLVSELFAARTRRRRLCSLLARQVALLQERRQALIAAAVTGQLDIPEDS